MVLPADFDLERMQERAEEAARLLKALGNPQRLRLLCMLVGTEMSVGQLNEQLPELSQSALSQHLAKLREEGLVRTRRESQLIWYSLEEGPAQEIIGTLYSIYCAPGSGPGLCPAPPARATKRRSR